ncbi:MAG: hypothetical protein GHHEDOFH_02989 [Pseudorhodoplanes sp.]|nr:hypothetical protein [Pseudorhodoplanes sp.]
MLALAGERGEQRAGAGVEHARHLGGAAGHLGCDLVGLAHERAHHFGADAEQGALDLAGILLERIGDARRDVRQRAFEIFGRGTDLLVAVVERGGGGAAAGLDLLSDLLGASDQKLLEPGDTVVERAGDLERAGAERAVDVGDLAVERVGNLVAARRDDAADLLDAPVERADDLAAAFGEGARNVEHAAGHRLGEGLGAAVERFPELVEPLVEVAGDLVDLGGDAAVEIVDMRAHRFGDLVGAFAETLDQLAAIDFHGAVELGQVPGDEVAEHARILADLLGQFGAAAGEDFLERVQTRREHVAHRFAARADRIGQHLGVPVEPLDGGIGALGERVGNGRGRLLQARGRFAAAQVHFEDERIPGRLDRIVDLLAAQRDRFRKPAGGFQIAVGHHPGAFVHLIDDLVGALRKIVGQAGETQVHHLRQVFRQRLEFLRDVVGFEIQARRQLLAGVRDGGLGLVARVFEPLQQVAAALAEGGDHLVAGLAERLGDVLAFLGQRGGDVGGHAIDLRGDDVADAGNVAAQVEMDALDRVAHLLGGGDEIVVLAVELVEQGADAHFVVVIGAFERGNLVVDERLKLGGARERAFHAVAHGGDLAADGLADGDDRILGRRFRLAQAYRHLRHGLRDGAHLARAVDHVREHEEEGGRQQEHGCERQQGKAGIGARPQVGQQAGGENADERDPDERGGGGGDVAGARGARLHALQQLADGRTVVVGGAAQLRADAEIAE